MKKSFLSLTLCCLAAFANGQNIYQFAGYGTSTSDNVAATTEVVKFGCGVATGPEYISGSPTGDTVTYLSYQFTTTGLTCYNFPYTTLTYGASTLGNGIKSVDKRGNIKTIYPKPGMNVPNGFQPGSMAADGSGHLYVVDYYANNTIFMLDLSAVSPTLTPVCTLAFNPSNGPYHGFGLSVAPFMGNNICFDGSGHLLIADYAGNQILMYTPGMTETTPTTAVTSNPRIICGTGTTISGSGTTGDGGTALAAYLYHPSSVAYDASTQNIYIEDLGHNCIRAIYSDGTIHLVAGSGSSVSSSITTDAMGATTTPLGVHLSNGLAVDDNGNLFFGYGYQILEIKASEPAHIYRYVNGTNSSTLNGMPPSSETNSTAISPVLAINAAMIGTTGGNCGLAFQKNTHNLIVGNCFGTGDYRVIGNYDRCPFFTGALSVPLSPVCQGTTAATTISNSLLTGNDYDQGQALTWKIASLPAHGGTLSTGSGALAVGATIYTTTATGSSITPTGSLTYTPGTSYSGTDQFTIVITDGNMTSAPITVNITITPTPVITPPTTPVYTCGNTVTLTATAGGSTLTGGTWAATGGHASVTTAGGQITGSSVGAESVTYTSTAATGSCVSAPINVSVAAAPAIGAIGAAFGTSVCIGNTIPLTNTLAGGTWTSHSTAIASVSYSGTSGVAVGDIAGVAAGTSVITYSVPTICPAAVLTATISVTVNAPTTLSPITYTVSSIAPHHSTTLSEGLSGTWSSSNTTVATVSATGSATSTSVYGVAGGPAIIYFTYTNSLGCTSSAGKLITVTASREAMEDSTGNNETMTGAENIHISPNPCNGSFTVAMPQGSTTGNIAIMDITGKVMVSRQANSAAELFNLANTIAPGTYIVQVEAEGRSYREKIAVY